MVHFVKLYASPEYDKKAVLATWIFVLRKPDGCLKWAVQPGKALKARSHTEANSQFRKRMLQVVTTAMGGIVKSSRYIKDSYRA